MSAFTRKLTVLLGEAASMSVQAGDSKEQWLEELQEAEALIAENIGTVQEEIDEDGD